MGKALPQNSVVVAGKGLHFSAKSVDYLGNPPPPRAAKFLKIFAPFARHLRQQKLSVPMRLHIFANRDLASNLMLNLLVPALAERGHDLRVFLSDKVGKSGSVAAPPQPDALRQLKFFEQALPNEILFPTLEKTPRSAGDKFLTFNELSRIYDVPVESLNDVRSPDALARLAALQPDLALSVRYGKIFGAGFLRIPKLGVINLHSGLLPNYRGVLATFRALQNGDREIGCTLHRIEDPTIDTGSVLGFSKIAVQPARSLLWHILSLYPAAAPLVLASIEKIAAGEPLADLPQPTEDAAYFSFPTEAELADFAQKGWKMTDPDDLLEIYRQWLG